MSLSRNSLSTMMKSLLPVASLMCLLTLSVAQTSVEASFRLRNENEKFLHHILKDDGSLSIPGPLPPIPAPAPTPKPTPAPIHYPESTSEPTKLPPTPMPPAAITLAPTMATTNAPDIDFLAGFPCGDGDMLPFTLNQNPSNIAYPQYIPIGGGGGGASQRCFLRMSDDTARPLATTAFLNFTFDKNNIVDRTFSMNIGYRIFGSASGSADGMVFVMHQDPRGVNAIGDKGGYLGVYGAGVIRPALVIEWDTFSNPGYWLDNGENNIHVVAISADGSLTELSETLDVPIRTDPSGSPTGRMWVDYCEERVLRMYINNTGDEKPTTPQSSVSFDLNTLFSGEDVVVGYAAGTWSQADYQDITSWTFAQTCSAS